MLSGIDYDFYRVATLLRLDAIGFGVLLYRAWIKGGLDRGGTSIISILFLLLASAILACRFESLHPALILGIYQASSIILLILAVNIREAAFNRCAARVSSIIAKQSYSVYLFHFVIIYLCTPRFDLNFGTYLAILFGFCSLFYYYFEKPIMGMRPRY